MTILYDLCMHDYEVHKISNRIIEPISQLGQTIIEITGLINQSIVVCWLCGDEQSLIRSSV